MGFEHYDVAVVGGGMSGMTAALLLANQGQRVVLLEAHTTLGGCAGSFRRQEFSFDVGATTFISFQPGGVGGRLLEELGGIEVPLRQIGTYTLCLPGRRVPICSDDWVGSWAESFPELGAASYRLFEALGGHADRVWDLACRLPSLPLTRFQDLSRSLRALRFRDLSLGPLFFSKFGEYLQRYGPLSPDLQSAFNMLLQDTTQNDIENTPTAYALLGLTLMRHGLFRPVGSTEALWQRMGALFQERGGVIKTKHQVQSIERGPTGFKLNFLRERRQAVRAQRLISAIPVWNTYELAPELFGERLQPYLGRREDLDGAFALYLGVRDFGLPTDCHHFQVLRRPGEGFSEGNNFLISLSGPNEAAAPRGFRSVTISCHSEPTRWESLGPSRKRQAGEAIVESFLEGAEELFPGFREAIVEKHFYPASPLTYARFTRRYRGMAGYQGLTLQNCLWNAIPRYFGDPDFLQIGDTGFPGAGTVACMVSGYNAYRDFT